MSQLETLIAAGIVPPNHNLSTEDVAVISSLSKQELDTLLETGGGLGERAPTGAPTYHVVF